MNKKNFILIYPIIGLLSFVMSNCAEKSPNLSTITKSEGLFSFWESKALIGNVISLTDNSKITYNENDSNALSQNIHIDSVNHLAFSVDKSILTEGEYITCLNQSVGYSSFFWDFGDGTTSSDHQVTHFYSSEGIYKIKLTALDNDTEVLYEKEIEVLTPNYRWLYFVNENIKNIDNAYADLSYLVNMAGEVYTNKTSIKDYYLSDRGDVGSLSSVTSIHEEVESRNSSVKYEIGSYFSSNKIHHKHLIIWRKYNGVFLRKFEVSAQSNNNSMDVGFLEQRRHDWVNGSNNHDANALVADLYTENAIYYAQRRESLIVGNSQIANEYQYMNRETYYIESLIATHCEPVNDSTIFEIGEWKNANSVGEYIFVWQKCDDGVWRVLLDSNY